MKISSLRIQNFRAFADETISFIDHTCLVGPNGGGKSTILAALNLLFRYSSDATPDLGILEMEDFHHRNTGDPICITAMFTDLSPEAEHDFANYYRHGKLIIMAQAKWNGNAAPVKHYGLRLGIKDFAPFFDAEGNRAKVSELRLHYGKVASSHSLATGARTKVAMIAELRKYEAEHPDQVIPILSGDEFYGLSHGKNLMDKYVEWVFVPAVKDVTTEEFERKTTALGKLLERTVRTKLPFAESINKLRQKVSTEYNSILAAQQSALSNLSQSLQTRLQDWAHPNATVRLEWHSDLSKAIALADPLAKLVAGEGHFEGKLTKFGHGFQRSLLLALLQELATGNQQLGPTLILGCEEPELYQHPPQVRHLASVFQKLASAGSQVILCTHNPHFIQGHECADVRLVRMRGKPAKAIVRDVTEERLAARIETVTGKKRRSIEGVTIKIAQILQANTNEMFFTPVLVLVEGAEDAAYVSAYMALTDRWEDFRRFGCHIVAAAGKTNIVQLLAIAKELEIPTFVVCDGDRDQCEDATKRPKHENDNRAILNLCGLDSSHPVPDATLWQTELVMWEREISKEIADDIGQDRWLRLRDRVKVEQEIVDIANLEKNTIFIGHLLAKAWEEDIRFPTLNKLCAAILEFAATHHQDSARIAA
jgi:predicted ATP-dependent endonuclease of OLD family